MSLYQDVDVIGLKANILCPVFFESQAVHFAFFLVSGDWQDNNDKWILNERSGCEGMLQKGWMNNEKDFRSGQKKDEQVFPDNSYDSCFDSLRSICLCSRNRKSWRHDEAGR